MQSDAAINNDKDDDDDIQDIRDIQACAYGLARIALPILTSTAVLAYAYASGGTWSSDASYSVCLVALVVALVLASGLADGLVCSASTLASYWPASSVEGFFDGAKAIADDILIPRIDHLVLGLLGKNADGSTADGGPSAADSKSDPPMSITPDRFKGVDAAAAAELVQEYRQIAYLLCRVSETYPDKFGQMMAAMG